MRGFLVGIARFVIKKYRSDLIELLNCIALSNKFAVVSWVCLNSAFAVALPLHPQLVTINLRCFRILRFIRMHMQGFIDIPPLLVLIIVIDSQSTVRVINSRRATHRSSTIQQSNGCYYVYPCWPLPGCSFNFLSWDIVLEWQWQRQVGCKCTQVQRV